MKVDDDTQKALLLFNRRAQAAEAEKAAKRRLSKAIAAKDEAAEELKRAQNRGSDAEALSEADSKWREAVDVWQRLRDGEEVVEETETTPKETTPEQDAEVVEETETTPEQDAEVVEETETTPEQDAESSATPEKEE
jgi:hypothetical protein